MRILVDVHDDVLLLPLDLLAAILTAFLAEELDLGLDALVLAAFKVVELAHVGLCQPRDVDAADGVAALLGDDAWVVGILDAVAAVAVEDGGGEDVEVLDGIRGVGHLVADAVEYLGGHLWKGGWLVWISIPRHERGGW